MRVVSTVMLVGMVLVCGHVDAGKEPAFPSDSLTLIDLDGTKIELSLNDVRALPRVVEDHCICVGEVSGYLGTFQYAGVNLRELLKKAAAAQKAGGYRKENMYLVFKGTDQYQVVASWNEVQNTAAGRQAMVVLEKDGKPLAAEEGALRLYFPGDKFVGRSVKCLDAIEIHCIDGVVEHPHEG